MGLEKEKKNTSEKFKIKPEFQLEAIRLVIAMFCLIILIVLLVSMYVYLDKLSTDPCTYIEEHSDMVCIIDPKFTYMADQINQTRIQKLMEIEESFGEFKEDYNGN